MSKECLLRIRIHLRYKWTAYVERKKKYLTNHQPQSSRQPIINLATLEFCLLQDMWIPFNHNAVSHDKTSQISPLTFVHYSVRIQIPSTRSITKSETVVRTWRRCWTRIWKSTGCMQTLRYILMNVFGFFGNLQKEKALSLWSRRTKNISNSPNLRVMRKLVL